MTIRPATAEAINDARDRSPFSVGPAISGLADRDELRYRDELELQGDPRLAVPAWLDRKELIPKLLYALRAANVQPRGTVVELGAGSCWLSATLVRDFGVERSIGVEFSRRRLEDLAPVAIATIGAEPQRIERRLADFYAHGLDDEIADVVVLDAAFHHAADPPALARVAFDLLKPGGRAILFREPTLSLLRRSRDHGVEDEHGAFEHEYYAAGYLGFLERAGFGATKHRAVGGFRTLRQRATLHPPLRWLNGIAFSEYTYVATKP
jgi:SAM-dependent methyltransferase